MLSGIKLDLLDEIDLSLQDPDFARDWLTSRHKPEGMSECVGE